MRSNNQKLLALLVGVNNYHPESKNVANLKGCVQDVETISNILEKYYQDLNPQIKKLKNEDATWKNITESFQSHLIDQADENTTVLFQFSGHGSYQTTAQGFKMYSPNGKDETLVCYDSRKPKGWDLADKHLALLINKVAEKNAHIVVLLDCCHSGSGTRLQEENTSEEVEDTIYRTTEEREDIDPRYYYLLQEDYANMKNETGKFHIPESKHILLAACQDKQQAQETRSKPRQGLFTKNLASIWEDALKRKIPFTYAELFARVKANILLETNRQTPVLEHFGGFDTHSIVLEGYSSDILHKTYQVAFEEGLWKVKLGLIHGLITESNFNIELAIFNKPYSKTAIGNAQIQSYGLHKSILEIRDNTNLDRRQIYYAKILNTSTPRLEILAKGNQSLINSLLNESQKSPYIHLTTENRKEQDYQLLAGSEGFQIHNPKRKIYPLQYEWERNEAGFIIAAEKIARWERLLALENKSKKLKSDDISFQFFTEDGQSYADDFITLPIHKNQFRSHLGKEWSVPYRIGAQNNSPRELYFTLLYFSWDFGIDVYFNREVQEYSRKLILKDNYVLNPKDKNSVREIFKLIVSTRELENYDFQQLGFASQASSGPDRDSEPEGLLEDWFTKTITVDIIKKR